MLRNVLAVVIGYGAMVGSTMLAIVLLARAYGLELTPEMQAPRGYLIANLGAGVLSAVLGGWLCTVLVEGKPVPAQALAGLVGVLGVMYYFSQPDSPAPKWYLGSLPAIGVVGVLIGSVLARRGRSRSSAQAAQA